MNLFNRVAKVQLDNATKQLLELETAKKRLEIDRDQISLELQNLRQKMQMAIEVETHKQKLEMESQKAIFEREKKIWGQEKTELLEKNRKERIEFEERLRKDSEIKMVEAVSLTKLESQQKIAQAEVNAERKINEVRTEMAEKVAKIQADESTKFYAKMTEAFQEMQLNGDKNSKFVQEMALRLVDKTQTTNHTKLNVDINTPQLEAPKDVN